MLNFTTLTLTIAVILSVPCTKSAQVEEEIFLEPSPHCSNIERHEIEHHLSTKTPYRVVANLDDKPLKYSGCKARRIWSVIRHGTRNPSKEHIEDALSDLVQLKLKIIKNSGMCPEELARMRFWQFNVSAEEEKYLVAEGEDELVELAERMQNRFPNLLPAIYDPSFYYFKYTATQRTLKSAQSFTIGLFGRHRIGAVKYPKALHRDPVLRVDENCGQWQPWW